MAKITTNQRRGLRGLFRRREDIPATDAPNNEHGSVTPPPSIRQGGTFWPLYTGGTALCVATVYRCVKLLSESVANLSVQFMKRKNGIYIEDADSRLSYLLNVQPNANMSAFDFWVQLVQNALMEGNAYVVPRISPILMDFAEFILCSRGSVSHDTMSNLYTITDTVNGIYGTFTEDEIIHIKGMTLYDQKHGISVLTFARLTLDIASAGDAETYDRFTAGGMVHGFVSNGSTIKGFGPYADKELEKTAAGLDKKFRDGDRIVSIPGEVEFKQISMTSADMQFLESRKFTVRDICRFFGVHPSFVFDDTSNNYKSAEMANVAFLSNTLNPILRKIETEFQRKLFSASMYGRRRIQFDRRGLYACDLESRVKYQADTIAAGLYTVNEWRREENKPPVEGGDNVLVSANLKSINDLTAGAAPAGQKTDPDDQE